MAEPANEIQEEQKQIRFEDMNLDERLLRGIYGYGFEVPSIIQQQGIPPLKNGNDTIAQAQSGTGKTATFSIGLLGCVDTTVNDT
jgi:superfamily II DNA/RNA helicase